MGENVLREAIELLKRMSEKGVTQALEKIREIKKDIEEEEKQEVPECPHCNADKVVRNGHKHNKQAYICRSCGKSFVETTKTALFNSHSGEAVWRAVIRDTVEGVSLDDTAANLDIDHKTVFNMRHKILFCLEEEEINNPTQLSGVCEADETYILESYKGEKLPDDFWRKPRKHGAVAEKPGVSNEYICICAGVQRDGGAVSSAVNRATAGKDDINQVFGERVSSQTLIISDGAKSYGTLKENGKCEVLNANEEEDGFFNINTVNGYHSFIKNRNLNARGFATKFLNRYNALFSKIYRAGKSVVDDIYNLLCDRNNRNHTINESQTENLLEI
jgi:transposase-like protein